jgi:hypothetical protein
MTQTQVLSGLIASLLAPVIRRAVFPETTYLHGGADVKVRGYHRPRLHETKRPLPPRDRLAARLSILYALKECERQLMTDMLADTEAIADAKVHNTVVGL